MSKFDSRVLDWVKGARVQPDGKITVLDNEIGCINKFERIESHEPRRSRSPLRRQNSGDVMIIEKMDTEKSNAVREKQNTENWTPPILHREPFQPVGPKVPSCGVAWMRSNGTLRLQLALKKLPYDMQKDFPKLPVKVPELATRGNILLLEYPQEHPGYNGMTMHIGPIQAGCSAEVPLLDTWPYDLPPSPPPPEKLKPRKAHQPPPIKNPEDVAKEKAAAEAAAKKLMRRSSSGLDKNLESSEAPTGKAKLKLKKSTPRRKSLPQWPPAQEKSEEAPAAPASPNKPVVNKLQRQWPPPGCGVEDGEEAATPVPSPLPSSAAGSPGPRNSRSSSMWTGSPVHSPVPRRVGGSPRSATPTSPVPEDAVDSRLIERKPGSPIPATHSSSPSRPRAPWGVAWTPDRSEYNSPTHSTSQSPAARRSLPTNSLFTDAHWNGKGKSASPQPKKAPRSPFQKTHTHTPRQKSSNPLFSDAHWDPDRTESDLQAATTRPRSATQVPTLGSLKGGSPRKKWPEVEYTPRAKMSPAAKTPRGEWVRDEGEAAAAKRAEEEYVDLASPAREVKKLDLKSKFAAYLHED